MKHTWCLGPALMSWCPLFYHFIQSEREQIWSYIFNSCRLECTSCSRCSRSHTLALRHPLFLQRGNNRPSRHALYQWCEQGNNPSVTLSSASLAAAAARHRTRSTTWRRLTCACVCLSIRVVSWSRRRGRRRSTVWTRRPGNGRPEWPGNTRTSSTTRE